VRGFIEHGTTTTPFDMTVLNKISRFHLVMDALNNSHTSLPGADELKVWCLGRLDRHTTYVREHMEDLPEIRDWRVGHSL
jgi:xylulose-5-phosphate/fructose-6-phosphate phosphoketolase